ncbi:MAG: hypothetical protein ACKVWR_07735 [Acidimicrobiales bacterium]
MTAPLGQTVTIDRARLLARMRLVLGAEWVERWMAVPDGALQLASPCDEEIANLERVSRLEARRAS